MLRRSPSSLPEANPKTRGALSRRVARSLADSAEAVSVSHDDDVLAPVLDAFHANQPNTLASSPVFALLAGLGNSLAEHATFDALADALFEVLPGTLGICGVSLEVASVAGGAPFVRAHGRRESVELERVLSHGRRPLGRLRVWAAERTPAVERLVEAIAPWLGVALHAALAHARAGHARARADHAARARQRAETTLRELLALDARYGDGLFEADTTNAADGTSRDRQASALRLASALTVDLGEQLAARTLEWRLTPRQHEVLTHIAAGRSNGEIAAMLSCSRGTIEKHVTAILRGARVRDRAALLIALFRKDQA